MRIASTVILLLFCSAAAAEEKYTIVLKEWPSVGKTVKSTSKTRFTGSIKVLDPDGKLVRELPLEAEEVVSKDTALEQKPGEERPSMYKRVYEKAVTSSGNKTTNYSYHGRTLVFQKIDGVYKVGVAGNPPLDAADVEKLLRHSSKSKSDTKLLFPDKPVAVGERWTINAATLAKLFDEGELDPEGSTAEGLLVKVRRDGKTPIGVMEINGKLAVKKFFGVDFNPPAVLEMNSTIETGIDGSTTAEKMVIRVKLKGTGKIVQDGKKMTLVADSTQEVRTEQSAEVDDAQARTVPKVHFVGSGPQWEKFTSKEKDFSIVFPGKPVEQTTKKKDQTTTQHAVDRDRGRITYIVAVTEYAKAQPSAVAELTLNVIAENYKKTTKSKKDIKISGYPAIKLTREDEQDGQKYRMVHCVCFVKNKLYHVIAMSMLDAKEKFEPDKFLDSFEIKPANAER